MAGIVMEIHEHGTWLEERTRVQCNYCQKRVSNYTRLKHHLGHVGTDVTHCELVPVTTREAFYTMVMEHKSCVGRSGRPNKSAAAEAGKQSQMCVGRFFYEHGLDFSAVDSTSFKDMMMMMMTVGGGQMGLKIPDSRDLNGWMLQEALKEVQDRVKEIKDSWKITGCSILLDSWNDQKGHDLVSFIADCPAGAVYLKSLDVSDIKTDVTALTSLVNRLVEEVGVHDVTQIIANSTSGWVCELGKLLAGHDRKVFWSVSLSHCFELMLLEIGKLHSFEDILDKVNVLLEYINNNPSVLKIFRDHSHGVDVTAPASEFEFLAPYLTLENIFRAKVGGMFASSDWKKGEGIEVTSLVNDSSFWQYVKRVLRCTSPLIHGLLSFSTANNKHVGYIYDTVEKIKKTIAWNVKDKKQFYKPIWDVIDHVWNHHLRNHLHAAGYFLNPTAYYSDRFHRDQELYTGLTFSLVNVVKEDHLRVKTAAQIDKYKLGKSCFKEASQAYQISGISPIDWWTQNASQYPELQSFSIKILSQTCEGASKYKMKRSLAEKLLLTEGMSHCDKKHLEELAFVHYNLHLQSWKSK